MITDKAIINCATYEGGRRIANINLDDIDEALKVENRFVWLGLKDPDETLMTKIQAKFGLHELAVEDAHRAHQRPKIESYHNSYFIALRTAQFDEETKRIDYGETHFFLGKNYLISIRHGASVSYSSVREHCENTPKLMSKGPGFALYACMDFIVDQYFPIMNSMMDELELLERKMFKERYRKEMPSQIYKMKSKLNGIRRAVLPLVDICNRLMRFDDDLIADDISVYFRDVYDHSLRINEMADSAKEQLTAALDANFSLTSIAQNEVSKKFAGWAAILALPTMIAGVYGMNFQFMPELNWKYGYFFAVGLMVASSGGLFIYLKHSKWV